MPKFFVEPEAVNDGSITLSGSGAEHLKVLRVREGEELTVNAGETDYRCAVEYAGGGTFRLQILSAGPAQGEPDVSAVVYAALPKGDKTEVIIQKAVELGAAAIVPTEMKRCVAKIDPKKEEAKLKRYRAIAESAAKQSGRNRIPEVMPVMTLKEAIRFAECLNHVFVPYEHADNMAETKAVIAAVKPGESVGIFIGPEGGFEESEVAAITEAGGREISLGKRILRTETAGMTLLSVLMFQLS